MHWALVPLFPALTVSWFTLIHFLLDDDGGDRLVLVINDELKVDFPEPGTPTKSSSTTLGDDGGGEVVVVVFVVIIFSLASSSFLIST